MGTSDNAGRATRYEATHLRASRGMIRGATWNVLPQCSQIPATLLLTPYLIAHLGVRRWGLYALALTVSTFFSSFDGGLGDVALRYMGLYAGRRDKRATTSLVVTFTMIVALLGATFCLIAWCAAPLLCDLLRVPRAFHGQGVFLLRSVGPLVTIGFEQSILNGALMANNRFRQSAVARILALAFWAAGVIYVMDHHDNLRGLAVVLVLQQALVCALMLPTALGHCTTSGLRLLPRSDLKEMGGFAWKAQSSSLAWLINTQFDAFIIAAATSLTSVAYYNAGSNLSLQVRMLATNALAPAEAQMTRTFAASGETAAYDEFLRLQRRWIQAVSGLCATAAVGLLFGLPAWLGPRFEIAGVIAAVLLAGHLSNLIGSMLATYAKAIGHAEVPLAYGTVAVIVNLATTVPLIYFGVLGIVIGTAFGQTAAIFLFIRYSRRRLGRRFRNLFLEVPLVRLALVLSGTVGGELWLRSASEVRGAAGLLLCAGPAAAGLVVYAILVFGPSAVTGRRGIVLAPGQRSGPTPQEQTQANVKA